MTKINENKTYAIIDEKNNILEYCRTKGYSLTILGKIKEQHKSAKIVKLKMTLKNNKKD